MSKYYGAIGYADFCNVGGKAEERITERLYAGDVIRNTRRWQTGEQLNDNLNVNNVISIVSDPYAYQNFHAMRYIVWMGAKWKISSVEVLWPRLLLTIGGVYNGDTSQSPIYSGGPYGPTVNSEV